MKFEQSNYAQTTGAFYSKTAAVVVLAAALFASPASAAEAEGGQKEIFGFRTIMVDIAENPALFVFDSQPVDGDGMPGYGNPFITQGYIYPAGTLNGAEGVNDDGSPEFPDAVLGVWFCRGWFVGNGAATETGPVVITTQIFSFGDRPGAQTIVTEGFEIADFGEVVERAVTGGTGQFSTVKGQADQIMLGFSPPGGVKLRMRLRLRHQ